MASVHPSILDLGQVTGKSAYQVWLEAGNEGTINDYLASLKGEQGIQGEKGPSPTTDDIKQAISAEELYDEEPTEGSTNLVQSGKIYAYLAERIFDTQIENNYITELTTINLKPQCYHIVTLQSSSVIPTLKFPTENVVAGAEVTISVRCEANDGEISVKLDESNQNNVFIDGNIATISASGALLMKGAYDGTHWFVHSHAYKAFTAAKAKFVLSGRNQYGKLASTEIATEVENNGGEFTFTLPTASDTTWGSLFGNGKCPLVGWVTNLTSNADSASSSGVIAPGTVIKKAQDGTYTFYPIYQIETINIADQTASGTSSGTNGVWTTAKDVTLDITALLKAQGLAYLPSDSSSSYPVNYCVSGSTRGNNAESYMTGVIIGAGTVGFGLSSGGKGDSGTTTKWIMSSANSEGKRRVFFQYAFTGGGTYTITLTQLKVGYSRYNQA